MLEKIKTSSSVSEKNVSLEQTRKEFEIWRKARKNRREPIPDPLWEKAVRLCRRYSVGKVSAELRLNFKTLKDKIKKSIKTSPSKEKNQFIEVNLKNAQYPSESIIEIKNRDGVHVKIYSNKKNEKEYIELVRTLLK